MATIINGTPDSDKLYYSSENIPLEIYGLGGNDEIYGGNSADILDGGDGNDVVNDAGGFAIDYLYGREGDDILNAGWGADFLFGGNGNDVARGGVGNDTIYGEAGNDSLEGQGDDDYINGGTGHDQLFGQDGNDTLVADGSYADAADLLNGGDGNDVYIVEDANFTLSDSSGLDRIEVDFTFSLQPYGFIEDLTLTGTAAINGTGNDLANTINGNDGANVLMGLGGNDLMRGYGGNDTLNAGGADGVEYMYGGTGDDTYVINDIQDTPVEAPGEGTDTVLSPFDWSLQANIENLTITGTASAQLTGNGLGNVLTGNKGNDYLDGGSGLDTLIGGAGNDFYALNDVTFIDDQTGWDYDTVVEAAGGGIDTVGVSYAGNFRYFMPTNVENAQIFGTDSLEVFGNELANQLDGNGAHNGLYGMDGNDTLDGGAGSDDLYGGAGNDTYILSDVTFISADVGDEYDYVHEDANGGTDKAIVTVLTNGSFTLAANVENVDVVGTGSMIVVGNGLNNVMTGNASHNQLAGLDGRDTLDGGSGLDDLYGGTGNDVYVLRDRSFNNALSRFDYDYVYEFAGEGTDTVIVTAFAGGSYTLTDFVEYGKIAGAGAFNLVGNAASNSLTGNADANVLSGLGGNDTLEGGGGLDELRGSVGNDIYVLSDVTNAGVLTFDSVVELAGEGTDTVKLASGLGIASYTLGGNIENGEVTGSAAFALTGNTLNNTLTGNGANNTLSGGDGADYLKGLAGTDTLMGGNGADRLVGGAGRDVMNGGAAADRFIYLAASDTGTSATTRDVIQDFAVGVDKIDLSALDAVAGTAINDAFVFGGSGAGHIRVSQVGADTLVVIETDAVAGVDASIMLTGVTATAVLATDFIL